MKIVVPAEALATEKRVPLVPESVRKLVQLGAEVEIEAGLGAAIHAADAAYEKAGARITHDRRAALASADLVARLRPPTPDDIAALRPGSIHLSYLDPFSRRDLVDAFVQRQISAISMELIPRTTIAQKMDALSSQASLGGYVAVILAAERSTKILPMMMTPAGTIPPARVFIIGAGVAGLQAIATAKRLGARVEAFDTRPVVKEQVQSLGAKFVEVDLGETGQTKDGYAKALTEEQLARQRAAMAKHCAEADIVVTTAQVFGRKAPVIITADMIRGMKPGSIVVDMAVETGGNVEGSRLDAEVDLGGVRILGLGNLPAHVAVPASQMYASNLANFIEHFWDKTTKAVVLNREDEIIKGCLVTHGGQVVNETVRKALGI
jgi:NAD(P) transhydrogenase subunit alpha